MTDNTKPEPCVAVTGMFSAGPFIGSKAKGKWQTMK
jgi:hypothetical protein